ncbi:restriction endonuclease [Streptomyces catenulae]|uniref:Restriction endonuclease n=1 Tax=Streptomyces catenulae TaxID=66875 RepID=A0ABV2Z4Z1_9ACTN|nr:restriction endonuclease [Streptomyces catenulae]
MRKVTPARLAGAVVVLLVVSAVIRAYPVLCALLAVLVLGVIVTVHRVRGGSFPGARGRADARTDVTHSIAAYQHMSGSQFEHAIADLARRDPGVRAATVSGGANDRALDVLVQLTDGRRIAVQCKRFAAGNRVGAPVVYEVNGTYRAYHRCDVALIVTTSDFTQDARRANAELDHPLRLVDGRALGRWVTGGRPPWYP